MVALAQVFVVGRYFGTMGYGPTVLHSAWDLIGVVSTEELARAACLTATDFFYPVPLDAADPTKVVNVTPTWPHLPAKKPAPEKHP